MTHPVLIFSFVKLLCFLSLTRKSNFCRSVCHVSKKGRCLKRLRAAPLDRCNGRLTNKHWLGFCFPHTSTVKHRVVWQGNNAFSKNKLFSLFGINYRRIRTEQTERLCRLYWNIFLEPFCKHGVSYERGRNCIRYFRISQLLSLGGFLLIYDHRSLTLQRGGI